MPSYNKFIAIGRLTRDPELTYSQSGIALATFNIAVDRKFADKATGERRTDFFRCKIFRQGAEFVSSAAGKGRLVAVDGRIEVDEVEKDGARKTYVTVMCDHVELLDKSKDGAE